MTQKRKTEKTGLWNPPEWMSDGAKAIWHRAGPKLVAEGILQPLHFIWFAIFCTQYNHVQEWKRGATTAGTAEERAIYVELEEEGRETLNEMLSEIGCDSESEFMKRFMQAVQ